MIYDVSALFSFPADKDPVRRDAVRRKAAKYLAKAEELYNDHISGSLSDQLEPLVSFTFFYLPLLKTLLRMFLKYFWML